MRNCSRFIFLGFLCKASPYYRKWTNAGRSRDNLFRFRRSRHLSHSPESSAECVEQQSSGESARTKQVQHCEDPGKPLKNHGCEPNRRPYQAGDRLCRAPFCFDYGRVIVGARFAASAPLAVSMRKVVFMGAKLYESGVTRPGELICGFMKRIGLPII